jgi:hypothetical protein
MFTEVRPTKIAATFVAFVTFAISPLILVPVCA